MLSHVPEAVPSAIRLESAEKPANRIDGVASGGGAGADDAVGGSRCVRGARMLRYPYVRV